MVVGVTVEGPDAAPFSLVGVTLTFDIVVDGAVKADLVAIAAGAEKADLVAVVAAEVVVAAITVRFGSSIGSAMSTMGVERYTW